MKKVDLKKEWKHLYQPSAKEVSQLEIPPMNFLMIDGMGDPNTSQNFKDAVEVLYSLSYSLKFMVKKGKQAIDYGVMPLEGLWWAKDMSVFTTGDKSTWHWTLMIMQPQWITSELVHTAMAEVKKKKGLAALEQVRFASFTEGAVAQTLHIGPFSEEGPTIQRVHDFIAQQGFARSGKHHEIYLSDLRKAKPEKWKTILRQPLRRG